jgi:hypothetical protein
LTTFHKESSAAKASKTITKVFTRTQLDIRCSIRLVEISIHSYDLEAVIIIIVVLPVIDAKQDYSDGGDPYGHYLDMLDFDDG